MQLTLQSFQTMVRNMAAAAQGACSQLIDLTTGSVELAFLEATAGVSLWLQRNAVAILTTTRLATSSGSDVDTWVADFGLTREPAVASSGEVTFGRFTYSSSALVPLNATIRTADLSLTFLVIEDDSNACWSAALGGYLIPASTPTALLPVQCTTAGAVGNVQIGAISLLGLAIPGIDYVNNALAFGNGIDAESDAALKARFQNFLSTLARGTIAAVEYAIQSLQQGLTDTIAENVDTQGNYDPGHFVVTIDDGSGNPSSTLLSQVYAAIDAVRPIGSTFLVRGPTIVLANVTLTITAAAGYVKANLVGLVASAIDNYIEGLGTGGTLQYFTLGSTAVSVPGVAGIEGLTVNGMTSDVAASDSEVILPGTVTVN